MKRAIRKHLRDFLAIVALAVIALLVGGYILSQPALLPARLGAARRQRLRRLQGRDLDGAGGHAGQGQTVKIAGVDVGEIGKVDLKDGRAVVTMKIQREVHADLQGRDVAAARRRPA